MNQGVKINGIQYCNTDQELFILNLITESDIYNDYRYTPCVDWEIEKKPEAHPKKLEFNINKFEIDLEDRF